VTLPLDGTVVVALEQAVAAPLATRHLDALLGGRIRRLPRSELVRRLEDAGLAWGGVNDLHEVLAHEQLRTRDRWVAVATPRADVRVLRSPVDVGSEIPAGPVPALGEHTETVLAWLDPVTCLPTPDRKQFGRATPSARRRSRLTQRCPPATVLPQTAYRVTRPGEA
jgi:crotonobetainyl-CoA:carnitine CoA-transferase CaiB-like acyl-CoA transferase